MAKRESKNKFYMANLYLSCLAIQPKQAKSIALAEANIKHEFSLG
jgi:hypothetical protein